MTFVIVAFRTTRRKRTCRGMTEKLFLRGAMKTRAQCPICFSLSTFQSRPCLHRRKKKKKTKTMATDIVPTTQKHEGKREKRPSTSFQLDVNLRTDHSQKKADGVDHQPMRAFSTINPSAGTQGTQCPPLKDFLLLFIIGDAVLSSRSRDSRPERESWWGCC